jgi:hypothetical protein
MKLTQLMRRGPAAAMLTFICATHAYAGAPPPVTLTATGPVFITTSDPPVPRGLGTPCVVVLFHNQVFPDESGPYQYTYAPPPDCPRPWAKVILSMDISGSRHAAVYSLSVDLAGVPIFRGIPPKYENEASWHVERDLTDDVALLRVPNDGQIVNFSDGSQDLNPPTQITGSAKLLFYRTSAHTPAPRVADVVYPILFHQSATLPHNIVRAYLDVFNAAPWWFTCVPNQAAGSWHALISRLAPGDVPQQGIFPPGQGCRGVSYLEQEVFIDGTPAGIVPTFPLLAADFNPFLPDTVDQPAPPSLMLNVMPYRVDLTPFAGVLNDAGPHTIAIQQQAGVPYLGVQGGQLLLYLDPGSVHVAGAVTLNTLTGSSSIPTVTNTLSASGDALQGSVITHFNRDFTITGFVNTSQGQIRSTVTQSGRFSNTQLFHLYGLADPDVSLVPRLYEQNLWLTSTTNRTSSSTMGTTVISNDQERVSYPLRFRYHVQGAVDSGGDSPILVPTKVSMGAHQGRFLNSDHYRAGLVRYVTDLDDVFDGSRARDFVSGGPDTNWKSFRAYGFGDNLGSCYEDALTAVDGITTAQVHGVGCPHSLNRVRWFAHPDGSPDSLGWAH